MRRLLHVTTILAAGTLALAGGAAAQQPATGAGAGQEAAGARAGGELSREQVRDLQSRLRELGFDPGPVDGILGDRTARALRDFQRARDLEATGAPTPETLQALGVARGPGQAEAGAARPEGGEPVPPVFRDGRPEGDAAGSAQPSGTEAKTTEPEGGEPVPPVFREDQPGERPTTQ